MKNIFTIIALSTLASVAQAEVINLNIYQNNFSVARTANFIHIDSARVKTIPKKIDQRENPLFDVISGESVYITEVLETEKVVELSISYDSSDAGSLEKDYLTANLPLASFSSEELSSRKLLNKAVASRYKMVTNETTRIGTEQYCMDMNFDDSTYSLEQCNRIGTRKTTFTDNRLTIVRK